MGQFSVEIYALPGSLLSGNQQTSLFDNPVYRAPSFTTGDLRALWRDADRRYTIIGFVKNVTDEVGYGSSLANPTGVTAVGARRQVSLIYPRTYGIGAQILRDLGVRRMKLLASPRRMPSMTGFDLEITGYVSTADAE